jgi:hypothetical protein
MAAHETPIAAATREATEELGPFPTSNMIHAHTNDHGNWAYHTVTGDAPSPFEPRLDHENSDHGWFTPNEIDELPLHPGFRESWDALKPNTKTSKTSAYEPFTFNTGKQMHVDWDQGTIRDPKDPETEETFDEFLNNMGWRHQAADYAPYPDPHEEFWRDPQVVYHGTPQENVPQIMKEGLQPMNKTRGIQNRGIGGAVFTSPSSWMAREHYGDGVLAIDAPQMKADGFTPQVGSDGFDEGRHKENIASQLEHEWYDEGNYGGEDPETVVFHEPIPPKYIKPVSEQEQFDHFSSVWSTTLKPENPAQGARFSGSNSSGNEWGSSTNLGGRLITEWTLAPVVEDNLASRHLAVKERPPNLHGAWGEHRCSNCKAFKAEGRTHMDMKGTCTMFDGYKVNKNDTCDDWESKKHSKVAGDNVLDNLSLTSVAHNIHYEYEKNPSINPKEKARQYLGLIGYPPDDMTIGAAVQTWHQLYPQDRVLELQQGSSNVDPALAEHWGDPQYHDIQFSQDFRGSP